MRSVVVRRRPSIGDCLLLGPLIREIKLHYPGTTRLDVLTDASYMNGGLVHAFAGIPGVDEVHTSPFSTETERIGYFDCDDAYLRWEWQEHNGRPPYGIAEFWLRHFGLYREGMDLRPKYNVDPVELQKVDTWLANHQITNPVGIVLRSGHPIRDGGTHLFHAAAAWLSYRGFHPITIDQTVSWGKEKTASCVGQSLPFVAALLSRCKAVLTPDTGLLHLSEAVGTPTVALWGIMEPRLRTEGYRTTLVPKEPLGLTPGCPCCGAQHWSCLRKIEPHHIFQGLEEALRDA